MGRVNGNMLRSPRGRQAKSRRQKALGSPRRVAKIDKALAAGPDLSDEQEKASQGLAARVDLHDAGTLR